MDTEDKLLAKVVKDNSDDNTSYFFKKTNTSWLCSDLYNMYMRVGNIGPKYWNLKGDAGLNDDNDSKSKNELANNFFNMFF